MASTNGKPQRPNVAPIVEQRRRRLQNSYEPKDIDAAGHPEWAYGCDKCKYGLIGAEDAVKMPGPLYLVRMFQAEAGRFEFCTCQAGNMMRQFLRNTFRSVESREDDVPASMAQAIRDAVVTPTFNGEKVIA